MGRGCGVKNWFEEVILRDFDVSEECLTQIIPLEVYDRFGNNEMKTKPYATIINTL